MTTNFCFRISFAGCPVSSKEMKASERIAKKYEMQCDGSGDKAVYFKMEDAAFRKMLAEHREAKLDYLIEVEGEDYTAAK